jgi:hypothetical protein
MNYEVSDSVACPKGQDKLPRPQKWKVKTHFEIGHVNDPLFISLQQGILTEEDDLTSSLR